MRTADQDVAIPNVQVLGVPFSPGQMAVQVDPAYDVAARESGRLQYGAAEPDSSIGWPRISSR